MEIKDLFVKNFQGYDEIHIKFNGGVTRLIGKNGSGKSSILTSIWTCFKGIAQKNSHDELLGDRFKFIGSNKATSDIQLNLYDEKKDVTIKIIRKVTKQGNQIKFEAPDGYPVNEEWLMGLLNVAFISPTQFGALDPKEQALALGIDTSKYDQELKELKTDYTLINKQLKAVQVKGAEKPTVPAPIDISELNAKKDEIRKKLRDQYEKNKAYNQKLRDAYDEKLNQLSEEVYKRNRTLDAVHSMIEHTLNNFGSIMESRSMIESDLKEGLGIQDKVFEPGKLDDLAAEVRGTRDNLPGKRDFEEEKKSLEVPSYIEQMPDDSELTKIDQKISEAQEQNRYVEFYKAEAEKWEEKERLEKKLEENKEKQEKVKENRLAHIKQFNPGFAGLEVSEKGELELNGRYIKEPYFSTGEMIKIVAKLHDSLDPELKFIFLDNFDLVDPDNQEELLKYLSDRNWQIVTAEVGAQQKDENYILMQDGKVVTQPKTENGKLF